MNEWGKWLSERFRARPPATFLNRWAHRSEGPIRSNTEDGLLITGKWFIGEPAFHLSGQLSRRGVAILGLEGHCLEGDRFQLRRYGRADLTRPQELSLADLPDQHRDITVLEWSFAGEEVVERGAQAVHVTGGAEAIDLPLGLLRAHVGRCSQDVSHPRNVRVLSLLGERRYPAVSVPVLLLL